jgi:hypothetical protein
MNGKYITTEDFLKDSEKVRPIKYRGKTSTMTSGNYHYGNLDINTDNKYFIREYLHNNNVIIFEVDPVSIGEFTSFKDTHKNEIYEGDIIKCTSDGVIGIIKFIEGAFYIEKHRSPENICFTEMGVHANGNDIIDEYEIIGNVYDNYVNGNDNTKLVI